MRYIDCRTEEDVRRFVDQQRRREERDQKLPKRLGIAVIAYLLFSAAMFLFAKAHDNTLADFSVTPGAVRTVDKTEVCFHSTREWRHWSRARDDRILMEYGLPAGPHPDFEIDHLIPLELGGADEDSNLWPQRRRSIEPHWNAERKDRLERELANLVCGGEMALTEAQELIRKDWVKAYREYIGANQVNEIDDGIDQE